jgi:hypothetical protein
MRPCVVLNVEFKYTDSWSYESNESPNFYLVKIETLRGKKLSVPTGVDMVPDTYTSSSVTAWVMPTYVIEMHFSKMQNKRWWSLLPSAVEERIYSTFPIPMHTWNEKLDLDGCCDTQSLSSHQDASRWGLINREGHRDAWCILCNRGESLAYSPFHRLCEATYLTKRNSSHILSNRMSRPRSNSQLIITFLPPFSVERRSTSSSETESILLKT